MDLKTLWNKLTRPTTEAERKMRMKYLVAFPAMFLTTGIILWLIFDSFGDGAATTNGFNQNMPEPDAQEITADKRDAYAAQKDTVRVATDTIPHVDSIPQSVDEPEPDMVEASDQAYQQVLASLQDFYIPEDNSASQMAELQARIDELEAQNAMAQQQGQQPNEMELMEQSYKLAAQYLGTGNGGQQAVIVDEPEKDRKVMPVNQVNRNVVSSLSASTDNTRSFSTAVGTKHKNFKNTISACIATDQSVTDGQSVRLRTLEPMWIGNSLLPKNTSIVGVARLQGERLEIKIESIEALGCIMEVDLSVYDSDGQEGINIPNSMESDALHEIGANMGSTMGSSINLTTNAGAQLASDVGKGLINGVSQYLNKKLRTVKVHLKSGYKIMLKQNEQ